MQFLVEYIVQSHHFDLFSCAFMRWVPNEKINFVDHPQTLKIQWPEMNLNEHVNFDFMRDSSHFFH